jgi:hypothetical protein
MEQIRRWWRQCPTPTSAASPGRSFGEPFDCFADEETMGGSDDHVWAGAVVQERSDCGFDGGARTDHVVYDDDASPLEVSLPGILGDSLLDDRLADQSLGELGSFGPGQHPAHGIPQSHLLCVGDTLVLTRELDPATPWRHGARIPPDRTHIPSRLRGCKNRPAGDP